MTNFLATLLENIKTLFSSPLTLLTLLACGILLIAFIKFKSIKFNAQLMARIGLALALAIILDMIKLYTFPNGGGSVSLGSMIPIFIISYAYGPSVGIFTGFLFGLLKLMINPYILSPIQVLFDYPLPFTALGLAGFFKDKRLLGVGISVFIRFLCHFISGVAFFGMYAPEGMSSWIYSLSVNGPMIGIEGIICLVIVSVLPVNRIINATSKFGTV